MTSPRSASRPARLALLAVLLLLAGQGGQALAAGTGGIEVTPVPGQRDGRAVTTFQVEVPRDGSIEVPFLLSNLEDEPRSARIYTARVTEADGSFSLDDRDSSPYVSLPDREVTLAPDEVRETTFTVSAGSDGPPDEQVYAAVVVEVRNGSVVQRANTLIYLTPAPRLPLPLLALGIAVVLLAVTAAAVLMTAARRRRSLADVG